MITVDNGVSALEALNKAKSYGIDIIVTDHHRINKSLNNIYSDSLSKFIKYRLENQSSNYVKFSSANFIINKEFFKKIGKFNELLDCYEDVDFNIRANLFEAKIF